MTDAERNLAASAPDEGQRWFRETGCAPNEDEHVVYLTNAAGDSLILTADDVAALVNARPVASAPDEGHAFHDEWSFQRSMSAGNAVAGKPIAANQPCFDCGVTYSKHARPAAPALDVERLAKAIWLVQHNTAEDHYDRNVPPRSPHRAEVDEVGEQVAAEYEALTQREGERAYERGEDHP